QAQFQNWRDFLAARPALRGAPGFAITDPVQQYLMATGRTLFKGMRFEQLHRMQVALDLADDETLRAIPLTDNPGWESEFTGSESMILRSFVDTVAHRDPDILEGHDIFRVTFEKLTARARIHKVKLVIGRDGSIPRVRSSRIQIAERSIQYPRYQVHG